MLLFCATEKKSPLYFSKKTKKPHELRQCQGHRSFASSAWAVKRCMHFEIFYTMPLCPKGAVRPQSTVVTPLSPSSQRSTPKSFPLSSSDPHRHTTSQPTVGARRGRLDAAAASTTVVGARRRYRSILYNAGSSAGAWHKPAAPASGIKLGLCNT